MAKGVEKKPLSKKAKLIWIAIALFSIFAIASVYTRRSEPSTDLDARITKGTAERVCQDVAVIKVKDRNIDVVSLSNYSPHLADTGNIITLQWNGRSKDSASSHSFICELTGTDTSPQIKSLEMDGERLQ